MAKSEFDFKIVVDLSYNTLPALSNTERRLDQRYIPKLLTKYVYY